MDLKKLSNTELEALYSMCSRMAQDEERYVRVNGANRTSKVLNTIVEALATVKTEIMNRIGEIAGVKAS